MSTQANPSNIHSRLCLPSPFSKGSLVGTFFHGKCQTFHPSMENHVWFLSVPHGILPPSAHFNAISAIFLIERWIPAFDPLPLEWWNRLSEGKVPDSGSSQTRPNSLSLESFTASYSGCFYFYLFCCLCSNHHSRYWFIWSFENQCLILHIVSGQLLICLIFFFFGR